MNRRAGRRRLPVFRLLLMAVSVGSLVWASGLYRFSQLIPQPLPDNQVATDAIVVLTGGAGRVGEGLSLLERGLAKKLFVSGVYRGVDVQELLKVARRAPGAGQSGMLYRVGVCGGQHTWQRAGNRRLDAARKHFCHPDRHGQLSHAAQSARVSPRTARRCQNRAAPGFPRRVSYRKLVAQCQCNAFGDFGISQIPAGAPGRGTDVRGCLP